METGPTLKLLKTKKIPKTLKLPADTEDPVDQVDAEDPEALGDRADTKAAEDQVDAEEPEVLCGPSVGGPLVSVVTCCGLILTPVSAPIQGEAAASPPHLPAFNYQPPPILATVL